MNLQKYNIYYKTWNDRWIKVNVNTGAWYYMYKEKSDKYEYVYNDDKIEYNASDNISVKMEFEDPSWRKDYKGKNLSQKISRAEFAAIAVKLYENLSKKNSAACKTKFTDISSNIYETDIQKAYNLGITNGVSKTWFRPLENISREQMAAMLTRTYKKSEFKDWTLKTDSKFPLDTTGISKFDDDEEISDWAKESVYFMNIIKGVDETHFSPKANPDMGEDYGFATIEQAIVIALRSFKNL